MRILAKRRESPGRPCLYCGGTVDGTAGRATFRGGRTTRISSLRAVYCPGRRCADQAAVEVRTSGIDAIEIDFQATQYSQSRQHRENLRLHSR
jgi:hypothetical protein